jgi:DNA ligase-1
MDDAERSQIWRHQTDYLGRIAKIKYFAVGMKDAPRHPVFLGWRDPVDASI